MPLVPLVENIHVTVTAESGGIQFHIEVRSQYFDDYLADYSFPQLNVNVTFYIQVGAVCSSRMPEFFLITLMSGSETTRHDQRNFTISPPPNVDVCTIRPRISAGNAAGTSPIETVEVGKFLLAFTINPRTKL